MQKIITNSSEETQKLGFDLAKKMSKNHNIFALHGDLGSGKTTFIQGLARGLGIDKRIISPTFIIMRTYKTGIRNQESGINNFYHVDLYRINDEKGVLGLELDETMSDPKNLL